jgi:hypothetical protein
LVHLGEKRCKTPEQFKAWSQNLGHESVLTTFLSYGEVSVHRQDEIMRGLRNDTASGAPGMDEMLAAVYQKLCKSDVAA